MQLASPSDSSVCHSCPGRAEACQPQLTGPAEAESLEEVWGRPPSKYMVTVMTSSSHTSAGELVLIL